jgi:DNA polymerase-1
MPVPTLYVRTAEELKQVVVDYERFSEFAFDVETVARRKVRMLVEPAMAQSRYAVKAIACPSCGRPIPTRRRKYCSDVCRSAAEKDKPALDAQTNEVWCISLAGPGRSDVIPISHPGRPQRLSHTDVFDALEPLFFSDRRKVNQNVGFDLLCVAKYYDWEIPDPPYADTLTLAFLLNENYESYKLGDLTQRYLGYTYNEKLGEAAYTAPFRQATRYSVLDAKMAWMLWWKFSAKLSKHGMSKLRELFDLEMDVLRVLVEMRRLGAYVDVGEFRRLRPELERQHAERAAEIQAMVGHEINLNSTQQLAKWLYDEIGLRCPVLTETGQRSTEAKVLKSLAKRHPAPAKLLEYKDLHKMLSTYIGGFIPHIDEDSRIRASFNQAVAKTGRLSCSAPNLQNIPARYKDTFEATMVRRLFRAPPGRKLIVADYSQIELRVLAHQTKDRLLVYAYTHGLDLHTQTASLIYRVSEDKVTSEQRSIAKNSNFNLSFEGGPGRIMDMSGISLEQAQKVYNAWHAAYPGVRKWGRWVKRFCWDHGYVETLYGRKRRLPEIKSSDSRDRSYAERQAVNHPIQGTAADIAKIGIVQVHEALRVFPADLVLQIHDEFVIEVDERLVDRVVPVVKNAMENIYLKGRSVLDVPLEVNIAVGNNWSEAKS